MNFDALQKLYFLGIGGIGMSALARFFLSQGKEIHGYDIANTSLTKKLEAEGMYIHYDIDVNKIPKDVDLVVLTPAIPEDHDELIWLRNNGYTILKRAEILGFLSNSMNTIAVAGTHGKTTTSSIITHILKYCGLDITAFLGGIMEEYQSNFFQGSSKIVVVEADEYDRSFLHLTPDNLIILSLDADHLDIYNDVAEMYKAYEQLTYNVKAGGSIILACSVENCFSDDWKQKMAETEVSVTKLGLDFNYRNVRSEFGEYVFELDTSGRNTLELSSAMAGIHNVINTSAAVELVRLFNLEDDCIVKAVNSFKGIKRRFEKLLDEPKIMIDDYAHHPSELKYAVETVINMYPEKRILGIFQPHLYSRTADFYREFAYELEKLNEIWLLPIYPAREKAIEGIQSELIYNLIRNDEKQIVEGKKLIGKLKEKNDFDVLITLGASDIDKYHAELIEVLKTKV